MKGQLIQTDTNTWMVMRENRAQPKGVVQRFDGPQGVPKFLLYTWTPDPAFRRLMGIYDTLAGADREVPWDTTSDAHRATGPNTFRAP